MASDGDTPAEDEFRRRRSPDAPGCLLPARDDAQPKERINQKQDHQEPKDRLGGGRLWQQVSAVSWLLIPWRTCSETAAVLPVCLSYIASRNRLTTRATAAAVAWPLRPRTCSKVA